MTGVTVRPYEASDADAWDDLVGRAANGTLLHTRRYLGYHGEKFADRSLVVLRDGRPEAVLPAALDPDDPACVVSHPGVTYGGLVHLPSFRGMAVVDALRAAAAHWQAERVLYKPVPHVFHRAAAQDDLWALFLLGATRYRTDLSWAVDLTGPMTWTGNRRRSATKAPVEVARDDAALAAFWAVLEASLGERHGVRPVHTAAEMADLMRRCPDEIALHVARRDCAVVAGAIVYVAGAAWHTQYLAASPEGRSCGALDAVIAYGVDAARAAGARWYDFGISNEDRGRSLNEGLFFYKSSFGGGSVVHEFYAW
jgi:hypothetical protein